MMQNEVWGRDLNTARLVEYPRSGHEKLKSSLIPMLFILVWDWDWEMVYGLLCF